MQAAATQRAGSGVREVEVRGEGADYFVREKRDLAFVVGLLRKKTVAAQPCVGDAAVARWGGRGPTPAASGSTSAQRAQSVPGEPGREENRCGS